MAQWSPGNTVVVLGAGTPLADAYSAATLVPNSLYMIFAGGALSAEGVFYVWPIVFSAVLLPAWAPYLAAVAASVAYAVVWELQHAGWLSVSALVDDRGSERLDLVADVLVGPPELVADQVGDGVGDGDGRRRSASTAAWTIRRPRPRSMLLGGDAPIL